MTWKHDHRDCSFYFTVQMKWGFWVVFPSLNSHEVTLASGYFWLKIRICLKTKQATRIPQLYSTEEAVGESTWGHFYIWRKLNDNVVQVMITAETRQGEGSRLQICWWLEINFFCLCGMAIAMGLERVRDDFRCCDCIWKSRCRFWFVHAMNLCSPHVEIHFTQTKPDSDPGEEEKNLPKKQLPLTQPDWLSCFFSAVVEKAKGRQSEWL